MTNVSGVNGANNDGYEYNKDNKPSTEVKSSIFNDLWSLDDYDGDGKFTMKDIHSNNTMFTKRVGLYLEKLIGVNRHQLRAWLTIILMKY